METAWGPFLTVRGTKRRGYNDYNLDAGRRDPRTWNSDLWGEITAHRLGIPEWSGVGSVPQASEKPWPGISCSYRKKLPLLTWRSFAGEILTEGGRQGGPSLPAFSSVLQAPSSAPYWQILTQKQLGWKQKGGVQCPSSTWVVAAKEPAHSIMFTRSFIDSQNMFIYLLYSRHL